MENQQIKTYYDDSAYACPQCGKPSIECTPIDWGYDCPDCKIHFETPDT